MSSETSRTSDARWAIGHGSRWGINLDRVHCPDCHERMPALRFPADLHEMMWGGWTCSHCGCRMDKWGRARGGEA